MKITRSQLKNLIKEEMNRINEGRQDIAAHSASRAEFLADTKLTVMYQEHRKAQWFQWTANADNKYMPHSPSITNNEKDKAPPGSILYPNDGPRIVVGDDSASDVALTQRDQTFDAQTAADDQL